MRDSNTSNPNHLTDEKTFAIFVNATKQIFETHKLQIQILRDRVAITYENGVIEIFAYDRPTNPRFEDGFFKFDWFVADELRTFCVKPIQSDML